jgi:hypothetical protein
MQWEREGAEEWEMKRARFFVGDNGIFQNFVDKIWRGKELMLTWQLHSQRLSLKAGRTKDESSMNYVLQISCTCHLVG